MDTIITQKHTHEDYAKLPEGAAYQLINGELVKEPSPSLGHQDISFNLAMMLRLFVDAYDLGKVNYAPVDVHLADGEIYQPDILFVAKDRLHIRRGNAIYGAPDLVVEILSPSTAYYDLRHKKYIYQESGVKEYWIIDPMEWSIEVYQNTDRGFVRASQTVEKGVVTSMLLLGLAIDAAAVFK